MGRNQAESRYVRGGPGTRAANDPGMAQGPFPAGASVTGAVAAALDARLRAVARAVRAVAAGGADVRRVHRLRSAARRAEAALAMLGQVGIDPAAGRAARRVRRRAGVVRDLDAARAELLKVRSIPRETRVVLAALAREQRAAPARELESWCAQARARKLGRSKARAAVLGHSDESVASVLRAGVADASLALERAAGSYMGDAPTLHAVRIAAKRLRYALEFAGPCLGDTSLNKLATRASGLTRVFGTVQDVRVLSTFVEAQRVVAPEAVACAGPRLARLAASRHARAARGMVSVLPALLAGVRRALSKPG